MNFNELIQFRRQLHQHPEISHQENLTLKKIIHFLRPYEPQKIIDLCQGKAILVEFDSGQTGPHLLFRADLDALPIHEENDFSHASLHSHVSHKCGHDGHMAMICSLAHQWKYLSDKRGKLGLLFQHAEEVGEGAFEIINDIDFQNWKPSSIIGMHNVPGFKAGKLIFSSPVFSCASSGLHLKFQGHTSHAAEPEKGNSPIKLVNELLHFVEQLNHPQKDKNFFLVTPVGIRLGDENYGITPGEGHFYLTLRGLDNTLFQQKKKTLLEYAQYLASQYELKFTFSEKEAFPALETDHLLNDKILKNAKKTKSCIEELHFPFLWSEDFGHYAKICPIMYFGIGSGEEAYPLHDPLYDFNDQLFELTEVFFQSLLKSLIFTES